MGTKPVTHQSNMSQALTTNNFTHRHEGNRGLNTQHVMRECKPGVWENKTKQMENEKWIGDG